MRPSVVYFQIKTDVLFCFLIILIYFSSYLGLLGLVSSGAVFALMQWGGRTHFLLAIVRQIPEVIFRKDAVFTKGRQTFSLSFWLFQICMHIYPVNEFLSLGFG